MSTSVSPHGFETVRGRGYRPEDVDRRVEGLSIDRDSCWERAARLTVLCHEMETEVAELRAYVAQLPEQTYEDLGDQARLILTTAESEAARLRSEADAAAERLRDDAAAFAQQTQTAADKASQRLRAEASEDARRIDETACDGASALVAGAVKDAEQLRSEASAGLVEMRRRTAQLLRDQEARQNEEWDGLERELTSLAAEMDLRVAELDAHGEAVVTERRRLTAETEESARHRQEDAEARAAELLAQARVDAERIERATERIVREHDEEREEVRTHMAHVRNSLAALTGKDPADFAAMGADSGPGAGGAAPEVDPDDEETVETQRPRMERGGGRS
ncbi:cellulose-binding protein [Streptomyces sp. GS7]|uniref:cellulose-binding protein n=1 Tax=Streptomyces sp. GS7 TaxID=2692234 RepID=UPI001F16FB3B|nr:cellulose-binding protein [Streptomyces sp. GS7]